MNTVLAFDVVWLFSQWLWPILMFLIGLGLVVFVHELGHFLVAKFVGIKVERFAIGMGWKVVGFRKGETEYCLCALPLGGYVKMLGQEDFAALEEGQQIDPRSYQAKSVGARFAVISAGVIMNIIFAALLFVLVGMIGIKFPAAVVGGVTADSPAATAEIHWETPLPAQEPGGEESKVSHGLKPGDRFLELDGDSVDRGTDLLVKPALSDKDAVSARIVRPLGGREYIGTTQLGLTDVPSPSGSGGTIRGLGVLLATEKVFKDDKGVRGPPIFQPGDKIVAMDGKPIEHAWEISRWEDDFDVRQKDVPSQVSFTVERGQDDQKQQIQDSVHVHVTLKNHLVLLKSTGEMLRLALDGRKEENKKVKLTLEDGTTRTVEPDDIIDRNEIQDILGMLPRTWVKGVVEDSPADEAGLEPGDIIYMYHDRVSPTPLQIRQINKKAEEGGGMIVVLRDGKPQPARNIMPTQRGDSAQIGIEQLPDVAHAIVADVREGSPAQKKGLQSEDRILQINQTQVTGWIDVFNALRAAQQNDREVALKVDRGGSEPITVALGKIPREQFDPENYVVKVRLRLPEMKPLMGPEVHLGPVAAMGWGIREVADLAAGTYITLKALLVGSVSTREVSGPVGIGDIAIQVGRDNMVRFVWFMAMISVSLAVINFLPLPVVDGGHAVFLIIEKIRGKPLPIKVQNFIQIAGLVLLIGVFLLITFQDITKLLGRMW
jgi:regulator of sigma E protease